jgi:hypothetical protein
VRPRVSFPPRENRVSQLLKPLVVAGQEVGGSTPSISRNAFDLSVSLESLQHIVEVTGPPPLPDRLGRTSEGAPLAELSNDPVHSGEQFQLSARSDHAKDPDDGRDPLLLARSVSIDGHQRDISRLPRSEPTLANDSSAEMPLRPDPRPQVSAPESSRCPLPFRPMTIVGDQRIDFRYVAPETDRPGAELRSSWFPRGDRRPFVHATNHLRGGLLSALVRFHALERGLGALVRLLGAGDCREGSAVEGSVAFLRGGWARF